MLQRIMNMGWTAERFGKFDRDVNGYRNSGRGANKPERIGKKYQWIAFHELLARLSDNFKMRIDHWSSRNPDYHGPWDIGPRRDIDPSNLLVKTHRENWGPHTNTWWFPTRYSSWDEEREEIDWLKNTKHLSYPIDIIEITDRKKGSEWLTLDGSYHWEQPTPLGEDRYNQERRDLWYMLTGYLIKRSDSRKLGRWAINQNWMGQWMPESHASDDVFLGEFFWSPVAKDRDDPYYGRKGWTRDSDGRLPCEVLPVNDGYSWSASSYDCSVTESIGINLPCRFLVESMNLNWRGQEGCWYDSANQLVAFDPSVKSTGPSVLLFRKEPLLEFLNRNGLTLFWTLLGEKRTIGGRMGPEQYHGHLEINGAYVLSQNRVRGRIRSQFVNPNHPISTVTTSEVRRRSGDDVS